MDSESCTKLITRILPEQAHVTRVVVPRAEDDFVSQCTAVGSRALSLDYFYTSWYMVTRCVYGRQACEVIAMDQGGLFSQHLLPQHHLYDHSCVMYLGCR